MFVALRGIRHLRPLRRHTWRRLMTKAAAVDAKNEIRDYLKRVAEINAPDEAFDAAFRLRCGSATLGLIQETYDAQNALTDQELHCRVVSQLERFPEVFAVQPTERVVQLHPRLATTDQRTDAIAQVLETLRDEGVITGWRNELYPVTSRFHDAPYFLVERAAAVTLGIKAYGVHINGYVHKPDGVYMWVGKRSPNKQTWPSRLDHIVAGGQPYGTGLMENVVKECEEEAGIPQTLAEQAKPAGAVSYAYLQPNGIKRDVLFVYDLQLPPDFVPQPNDGEVESFSLYPISEVQRIVRQTQDYKPNCAVVVIDFLVRHGYVSPDQTGYLELLTALRRGDLS